MTGRGRWEAGATLTTTELLDAGSRKWPDQACLVVNDEVITYSQLHERALSASSTLAELGLKAGETVAIFAETCPEWIYAWFGAVNIGALAVPINTAYRGDFLANPLRDCTCRLALVDDTLVERLENVAPDIPHLRTLLVHPTDGTPPDVDFRPHGPGSAWDVHDATVLTQHPGTAPSSGHVPTWSDPACILYTSGTTGPSKGAVITHQYLAASAGAMVNTWRLEEREVLYAPLPLYHISAIGSIFGPMFAGGTGVVDSRFGVHSCWDRVRRYDVAGILLAGVMVNMLWNLPPDPRDGELPLRFMSAAPIPRGLRQELEHRYNLRVLTSYGMTEAFPMTVYGLDDEVVEGACGRPQANFDVAILDDQDRPVAPGTVGEICCRPRSPHVMFEGYYGRDDATVSSWRNLWFHSGDLGRMDEDQNLTYVDRSKDAMRRRGENISSFEVEQTLLRHPAVAEAAAVGVASDVGEDDVKVVVSLKPGAHLAVENLMDFCVERLPYFAVPRFVEVVDHLPVNETGKVLKTQLRAGPLSDSTWDRERAGYVVAR